MTTYKINFGIPRGAVGAQGPKGEKGDKGATGDIGPQGPIGPEGPAPTIVAGTITTLEPGQDATVEVVPADQE